MSCCTFFFFFFKFLVRQERLKEGWRQLLLPNIIVEGNPTKRLMAACVKLYKDLLLLENFAIMNYCGFSKILKKHDKLTGQVILLSRGEEGGVAVGPLTTRLRADRGFY